MESLATINIENHRSRERIKLLGEVFTPDEYVNKMLDLLDPRVWADDSVTFFEPTCGHGNFIVALAQRRLVALEKKYRRQGDEDAHLYAVANTLHTIWGIDIDSINISLTRKRLFSQISSYLAQKKFTLTKRSKIFLAHVLSTIVWQVSMNEALSALANKGQAENEGSKTNLGKKWLSKNDPKAIDFSNTWFNQFNDSKAMGVEPLLFKKSLDVVEKICAGKAVRDGEFSFATEAIQGLLENGKPGRKEVA